MTTVSDPGTRTPCIYWGELTVRQVHLRTNKDDFPVEEDYSAIVPDIPMPDRHTHIDHYVLTVGMIDDASKHLPGVQERVSLQEVIQAAIAGDFELRTNAQRSPGSFS